MARTADQLTNEEVLSLQQLENLANSGAGQAITKVLGVFENTTIVATVPQASASVLGGIKVGSRLSIDAGTGVLSADVQAGTGDVFGPATHAASYLAQWNATPNSKTLVEGLAVPAGGLAGLTALGGKADINQTMYIGTTAHALNRTTAAEVLTGITGLTPSANFVLTQNSVNAFTSEETGALVNTLYLKAGNVGIGTTAPGATLDVKGNQVRVLQLTSSDWVASTIGQQLTADVSATGFDITPYNGAGYGSIGLAVAGGNVGIGYTNGGTAKLAINGNVGIGTTNPTQVLDVESSTVNPTGVLLKNNNADANSVSAFTLDSTAQNASAKWVIQTGTTVGLASDLVFTNQTTARMIVQAAGNVGIGTTSPQTKLALASGSAISFEASAGVIDIALTHSVDTLTLSGGNFALGANSLTLTGSIGATGARATKGWFADMEITALPTINGGTLATALNLSGTNTGDNSANSTYAIGSQTQAYNANLTAINQALTTTSSPSFTTVTAALTGTASGNLTSANIVATITNGVTDKAPSEDAIFDALALKANLASPNFTGTPVFPLTSWANLNLAEGQMINGRILPSVTSNNLTVALKTLAGTDPSATDPVYVMIGGVVRSITGALSLLAPAGYSTSYNAGSAELVTKEIDYFTYLSWNTATSAVDIGISRIPYATLISDFSVTYANEKYGGDNLYNNTSTDVVVNIGRFAATMAANGNWSVPTFTASNLIQRPVYETRWLAWLPSGTGYTAGGAFYKIVGDNNHLIINSTAAITANSSTPFGANANADTQLTTSVGTAVIAKSTSVITVATSPKNIVGFYGI